MELLLLALAALLTCGAAERNPDWQWRTGRVRDAAIEDRRSAGRMQHDLYLPQPAAACIPALLSRPCRF